MKGLTGYVSASVSGIRQSILTIRSSDDNNNNYPADIDVWYINQNNKQVVRIFYGEEQRRRTTKNKNNNNDNHILADDDTTNSNSNSKYDNRKNILVGYPWLVSSGDNRAFFMVMMEDSNPPNGCNNTYNSIINNANITLYAGGIGEYRVRERCWNYFNDLEKIMEKGYYGC